jgi:acylphosphatase
VLGRASDGHEQMRRHPDPGGPVAEIVRKRVVVDGVVQGVFFRAATQRQATALGVKGWVRNRSDGGVEAVFEGPADAVDAAVTWMRSGPERAIVTSVEVFEEDPEGLSGFGVRY